MKLDLITQTEKKAFTLYFTFWCDYFSENRLNHSNRFGFDEKVGKFKDLENSSQLINAE